MGNIPNLRLRGFIKEWEPRVIGEITTSFSGGTPSADNSQYYGGDIPFIRSGEISNDHTELFLTESGVKNSAAKLVQVGDILYALYGATSGEVSLAKFEGAINQAILDLRPDNGYDASFIAQLLRRNKEKIINTYLQGGQGNLSAAIVKSLELLFPILDEQQSIARLLVIFDKILFLFQRKLDSLISIRRSMLCKMLPRNGNRIPEIRFTGFDEEWNEFCIGEVTRELNDYATLESGLPLLTSSRSGLMFQNQYRNNLSTSNTSTLFSVVPKGSCTYRHMSDDDVFHFNINTICDNGLVSREYPVFIAESSNDLSIIVLILNDSDRFRRFCREQKVGGTRTRLYYKNLATFTLLLPKYDEQKKIAEFFFMLDNEIEAVTLKTQKLNAVKKSLLKRMFV